ncbi:TIGR03857 family LLM class F420-dependent oxidoreductase [Nocardioides insulae]|uniref:TIGR03857 family LLM class F420-dependent oxidoreductase n=1 Tax=Nocardioides insulae TaxID=394734 RepID=UPI00041A13EA|nr:TIGR03857 family LLM class F420-dependent oxidoreductase [Nocardioides insulae]
MPASPLPELGFYALAGGSLNPRDAINEVRDAEELGLGTAFLSERLNVKESFTITGALGATSTSIGIATGVTNFNTRHPLVTAAHGATMQALTGGRYTLGIGRGIDLMLRPMGLRMATTAQLEDFAHLIRRLCDGEVIQDHQGPAGSWPLLRVSPAPSQGVPLLITAFGPNTLKLAARAFDAVVLHTFFSDETTRRCVQTVREECERIGRDPASVRIWSCYATVRNDLPEETFLLKTTGRLAGYLQGYGDLLVATNDWDPAPLERFRADPTVRSIRGPIDSLATPAQLEHIGSLLPEEWLASAAIGTSQECAAAVDAQFDLGVDGVIMHGATPEELAPVVDAYRAVRRHGRASASAAVTA